MKRKLFVIFFLIISISGFLACKDDQMDHDPIGNIVVGIYGYTEVPPGWTAPMVYASYPRPGRVYDTGVYDTTVMGSPVIGGYWSVFVERYSAVSVFLFDDKNMNGLFDYRAGLYFNDIPEQAIGFACNPVTVGGFDYSMGNSIKLVRVHGTITYTSGLQASPELTTNLMVALVYPYPNSNCYYGVVESYAKVDANGNYQVYGIPKNKYKLWIFSDKNGNGVWDNGEVIADGAVMHDQTSTPNTAPAGECVCSACDCPQVYSSSDISRNSSLHEPYVQIPARGAIAYVNDTFIDMSATADKQIDITLGVVSGTFANNGGYATPQASLFQGWDVTAYNTKDSTNFSFFAIKDYSEDGGGSTNQSYHILLFDDDNPHDGIYVYADENDEYRDKDNGGAGYSADATGLSLDTTP